MTITTTTLSGSKEERANRIDRPIALALTVSWNNLQDGITVLPSVVPRDRHHQHWQPACFPLRSGTLSDRHQELWMNEVEVCGRSLRIDVNGQLAISFLHKRPGSVLLWQGHGTPLPALAFYSYELAMLISQGDI